MSIACCTLHCIALAAVSFVTLPAFGQDAATQDLLDRLAELEAKSARDDARNAELESRLAAVEQSQSEQWLTEQRADEIRHLVQDVLADADTRASLLQSTLTAGYDHGFIIQSSDGNWLLRTNFLLQERLVVNRQRESPGDNSRWGFENSRTRFTLSGSVVQPEVFYLAEIEVAGNNTGYPNGESRTGLGNAIIGYDFGQGWRLWFGTFKTPILREELVDAGHQLAVERSVVNYLFTGGRTDGLVVEYRNAEWRLQGSYNNGINDAVYGGAVMTGGTAPVFSGTADMAFTGRAEWLLDGDWSDMNQFSGFAAGERGRPAAGERGRPAAGERGRPAAGERGRPARSEVAQNGGGGAGRGAMMIGGALHYQRASDNATGAGDLDLLLGTIDFTGQFERFSVFGAVIFATTNHDGGIDADPFGIVIQASTPFAENWEAFARYEWADMDGLTFDDVSIITIGATKYLHGHRAKWTTDIGFGLDPVTVPITSWRADLPGEDKQAVFRSQLQIMF